MTTFDPEATIERAAKAEWHACWPNVPWDDAAAGEWLRITSAALTTIAADVLAPIEAKHQQRKTRERLPNGVSVPWNACTCGFPTHSACPTAQAIADIKEKAAGVR